MPILTLKADCLPRTQRALVIFGPDANGMHVRQGVILLSRALMERGLPFRIAAPAATSLSHLTAQALFPGTGPDIETRQRFMSCGYADPRVPQAPLISLIIETERQSGLDLARLLSGNDIIGPMSPEDSLREIKEQSPEALQIKKSIRYLLTLGEGDRNRLFPYDNSLPVLNRIRVAATDQESQSELALMYSGDRNLLAHSYDQDAAAALTASWPMVPPQTSDKKVLLTGLESGSAILDALSSGFNGFNFRDFTLRDRMILAYGLASLNPFLLQLNDLFVRHVSGETSETSITIPSLDSSVPPIKPEIIALCGDIGVGKTEALKALTSIGYQAIPHYTDRTPRPGETEGIDYHFVSQEQMQGMLARGLFSGVDRVGDHLYGLIKTQLHPGVLMGHKFALVTGPNTVAGMRHSLAERANLCVALIECSPAVQEQRLRARGGEATDLARRLKWITWSRAEFELRAAEFDIILSTDKPIPEVHRDLQTLASEVSADRVPHKTGPFPHYVMTPAARHVQVVFDRYAFENVRMQKGQIPSGPLEQIEQATNRLIVPWLTRAIEELAKAANSVPFIDATLQRTISKILVPHLSNVFAASRQLFSPFETLVADQRRFGRLFETGDMARGLRNLNRIRAAAETVPENERDLIILLHDLGKTISFFNHPRESVRLIRAFMLTEYAEDISDVDLKIDELFIKYHHSVTSCALTLNSWTSSFVKMFADPEAVSLLRGQNGIVNTANLEKFLRRFEFFNNCDTAGSTNEWGGAENIKIELYFSFIDKIRGIFMAHSENYDEAVRQISEAGKEVSPLQLVGMLLAMDPNNDTWVNGIDHYHELLKQGKEAAITAGMITQQKWDDFLADLRFIDFKYPPQLWWMAFGPNPTAENLKNFYKIADVPPLSIFNFFAMISELARQALPDIGPDKMVTIYNFDREGNELAGTGKEIEGAWIAHNAFSNVRSFRVDGNNVNFIGTDGSPISDISAEILHGESGITIRFKFNNLSFVGREDQEY